MPSLEKLSIACLNGLRSLLTLFIMTEMELCIPESANLVYIKTIFFIKKKNLLDFVFHILWVVDQHYVGNIIIRICLLLQCIIF